MHRFGYVLLMLSLVGCSHSSGHARGAANSTTSTTASVPTHPPSARVTTHLEVAPGPIKAGSAVRIAFVIENDTGNPIRQPVCHRSTEWQAYLTNGHDASGPLPTATVLQGCDRTKPPESVPTGESRLSYTTHATYFSCANAPDSYPPTAKCLEPGDKMPPLPAGRYRIAVNASPYVGVPKPAALPAVIVG